MILPRRAAFLFMVLLAGAAHLSAARSQAGEPVPQAAPAGWTLAFQDDFDRDALGINWLILRGDWRIEDGRLRVTRDWTSDSAIRTVRPMRENVRLEFDARALGPHYLRAGVRIGDQYWDGGGAMRAGRGARGGEDVGDLQLYPPDDANAPQGAVRALKPDQWQKVALEYEDGRLHAWVDGRQVMDEAVVLTGRFNDYVALFAIKDAEFDNVRIYTKPYRDGFRPEPVASLETNRSATAHAEEFLDRAKPACGFQEAIDSLPPTGGAVILPEGEFTMHATLFLPEGVSLRGQGAKTVLSLPSPIVWTKLTEDAPRGATALKVEDGSAFEPGWQLSLGVDPMYYLRADTPWTVKSASRAEIELNKPLGAALRRGAPVGNWFPVIYASNCADVEVRDLTIEGRADDPAPFDGGYGASAVTFFFVRNARCHDVVVNGWKGDGLSFQGGRDNSVTGCVVRRATGHGFHPGSCQQRTIVSRCRAEECGGDGLYYCRYNQQSVTSNNVFIGNKGATVGGLASAGDAYNVIAHNFGRDNGLGIPIARGANDVIFGNVLVDSAGDAFIRLAGGEYGGRPHTYHVYAGPSRYHVIVGNTFVETRGRAKQVVVDDPGAAANVAAGNTFHLAQKAGPPFVLTGPGSVAAGNVEGAAEWQSPRALPPIPPLPEPVLDAAPYYDPGSRDCGFQKAMDDLAARGGGTVRLPAGRYALGASLRLPSNITLCGEGLATVIEWRGGIAAVRAVDARNVGLRRLRITGPGPLPRPRRLDGAVSFERVAGGCIEGVDMEEVAGNGLHIYESSEIVVGQCRIRGAGAGILSSRSAPARFVENHVLENADGIVCTEARPGEVLLDSNIVWRSRRTGITISHAQQAAVRVVGNVVSTSGENGLTLSECRGGVIEGNVVHDASLAAKGAHAGIVLGGAGVSGCRVVGNRVGDDLHDPFQLAAVREEGGAKDNVIQWNVACPENWPLGSGAKLDPLIRTVWPTTVVKENVLEPYPPRER